MTAASDDSELLAIEQAAVRAWPAAETAVMDGWLWRYSGGVSGRANSVSPLAYDGADIEASIDAVEARYRARAMPARFQVGARFSAPHDLDARLAARGYTTYDEVTTLAKPVGATAMPSDVRTLDTPDAGWMEVYLSNITPDRRPPAPAILDRVPRERKFLACVRDGVTLATALGVRTGRIVIAECIGTRADLRRSGAASAVMRGLEAWAREENATTLALQVVAANAPAQALYRGLGYTDRNRYHYRIKP
jgi:GNAT superfamily N-acetyltransferase